MFQLLKSDYFLSDAEHRWKTVFKISASKSETAWRQTLVCVKKNRNFAFVVIRV